MGKAANLIEKKIQHFLESGGRLLGFFGSFRTTFAELWSKATKKYKWKKMTKRFQKVLTSWNRSKNWPKYGKFKILEISTILKNDVSDNFKWKMFPRSV
jgi:hypothetical protein